MKIQLDTAQKRAVLRWMRSNLADYVDDSGEIMLTELAESAAGEFNVYENEDYDIPEWVFEFAFHVSETQKVE